MRKLSKRETFIFISCVVLLVIFGFFRFVLQPLQEGQFSLEDRLRLTTAKLNKATVTIANSEMVNQRLQQLKETIGTASSESVEMSNMVSVLETAARQADIHIVNMQPQRTLLKEGTQFFPVDLNIEGQWPAIVKFLYLVQQRPNFYFINELNMEKSSGGNSFLRARIVVSLLRLR